MFWHLYNLKSLNWNEGRTCLPSHEKPLWTRSLIESSLLGAFFWNTDFLEKNIIGCVVMLLTSLFFSNGAQTSWKSWFPSKINFHWIKALLTLALRRPCSEWSNLIVKLLLKPQDYVLKGFNGVLWETIELNSFSRFKVDMFTVP